MRKRDLAILAAPILLLSLTASAGDIDAGKAAFEKKCADCHETDDFSGESAEDIANYIAEVKTNAMRPETGSHMETESSNRDKAHAAISAEEKADVSAFWASIE